MAIVDRLKRLFSTGETPANTSREITPVKPRDLRGLLLSDERSRHETIRRCRDMYAGDPRAEGMLRMMARDATRNGFIVTVTGDTPQAARAQALADAAVNRLKLKRRLPDWLRLAARDGDLYLEAGIGAGLGIVEVTRKPTLNMLRLSDAFDRFADPARAFAWVDATAAAMGLVNEETATFFPQFLIVHARWNHDSESRYGTPEYASALAAWKKLTEGELDLSIRRKTRAGVKYVHRLVGASEADIETYKLINETALDNPYASAADFFINFEGGIDVLDGDGHLGDLADIRHHLQTWSSASAVPLELLAFGENLNRDVLEDKKRQYDETLGQIRAWAADEIVIPLLEREWLLAGILPETLTVSVGWPSTRDITPSELAALVAAVNEMRATGWNPDAIWAIVEPYVPDELSRDSLFDTPVPEPVAAAPAATAETIGAINRLLGRMESATDWPEILPTAGGTEPA